MWARDLRTSLLGDNIRAYKTGGGMYVLNYYRVRKNFLR
jgi:hypothetical protein